MDERFRQLVCAAFSGSDLGRAECEYLLSFPEDSEESEYIISKADSFIRGRCGDRGEIGAQIGIITGPCYADCGFCSFAYSTTDTEEYVMGPETLERYLREIVSSGAVTTVSLMTIHDFDFDDLLDAVILARRILPGSIGICVNTGDLTESECFRLRDAGVGSSYHAIRLGESIDNGLEVRDRHSTIKNLEKAGIRVATGVEPIGPEHTPHEIADTFYNAMDLGCSCCSASARVPVIGTRMYGTGSISERRLLQIRSCLIISSMNRNETELGFYGGFYGGLNRVYAEFAGSPKDNEDVSESGLGHTIGWARRFLSENGFHNLRRPA